MKLEAMRHRGKGIEMGTSILPLFQSWVTLGNSISLSFRFSIRGDGKWALPTFYIGVRINREALYERVLSAVNIHELRE